MDISRIRQDFPLFHQTRKDKPLIYFDNACQTLRPWQVINAIQEYYRDYRLYLIIRLSKDKSVLYANKLIKNNTGQEDRHNYKTKPFLCSGLQPFYVFSGSNRDYQYDFRGCFTSSK